MAQSYIDLLGSFVSPYRASDIPVAPCPACDTRSMRPGEPDFVEDPDSAGQWGHPAWEPTWVRGRFSVKYRCGSCESELWSLGSYVVVEDEPDDYESPMGHIELMTVDIFYPPLRLMEVPVATPDTVLKPAVAAGSAWPGMPGSAANLLRQAVEQLLTEQGVAALTAGPKASRLSLEQRLKAYTTSGSPVADLLKAVKWIGNDGSHSDQVERADVLAAARFLQRALVHLYDNDELAELTALAKRVNQVRGARGLTEASD